MAVNPSFFMQREVREAVALQNKAKAAAAQETPGKTGTSSSFFGDDGFSFGDILDMINPLQHIPGLSTIYRAITGDEISTGARLAGGTLFGGPLGFVAALANSIVEEMTGKDIGEQVAGLFDGSPAPAAVAGTTGAEKPLVMADTPSESNPFIYLASAASEAPTPLSGDVIEAVHRLRERPLARAESGDMGQPALLPAEATPKAMEVAWEKYQVLLKSRQAPPPPSTALDL